MCGPGSLYAGLPERHAACRKGSFTGASSAADSPQKGGNGILSKTGKAPVMRWDKHTLTAFGGISAILIGSAMVLEDATLSFGPITAIIIGIAAIVRAGLDRLKERVA